METKKKGFFRKEVVEFALDQDVIEEIERQKINLETNPDSARIYFDLGVLYYSQKKVEEAISCYKRAIELDPKMARAHKNLGEIYVVYEKYDEAWECASKAADLGNTKLIAMMRKYLKEPEEFGKQIC